MSRTANQNTLRLQAEAHIRACAAIAGAILELREVPNGVLYGRVMMHLTPQAYHGIVETLKRTGIIEERNCVLRWIDNGNVAA